MDTKMKKITLTLVFTNALLLAGCVIPPNQIPSTSTAYLCRIYSDSSHPNYFDPLVRRELERRSQGECTSPQGIAAQRAIAAQATMNSMQMLNSGNQLMQLGQPQVISPAPNFPVQRNCVSRMQGNQMITQCN
jgi:hypothetical protein